MLPTLSLPTVMRPARTACAIPIAAGLTRIYCDRRDEKFEAVSLVESENFIEAKAASVSSHWEMMGSEGRRGRGGGGKGC